jgi:D-glycero-D-manno-heptose 1,7-bisphosphate phosphatase
MRRGRIAVFLDRDGVINADSPDFIKSWDEFKFLPGTLEALAVLSRTTYAIVIVTNQSGLGRGLLTEDTLRDMHNRMLDRIGAAGGRIDAIYYCPHCPGEGCECRKPLPGLFLRAAAEMNIDLSGSWMIGDSARDVQAASAAGVKPILLGSRSVRKSAEAGCRFVANLREAVEIILRGSP